MKRLELEQMGVHDLNNAQLKIENGGFELITIGFFVAGGTIFGVFF